MTIAGISPPLPLDSLPEALAALRARGLRISASRRLLLEALFAADGPASAERIADGLDGRLPASDLTSVYRNLEAFEELGVVRHVHLGHGPGLYALAGREGREYLVCESCDRVQEALPGELDDVHDEIRARFGYRVRFAHFPLVGLCPDCAGDDRHDRQGAP